VHRWGDELRCYLTFKRKSQFSKLSVNFNLPSKEFAQPNPEQQGAFIGFQLANARKIGRQTYEVSGVVSLCVPGIYVLLRFRVASRRSRAKIPSTRSARPNL
jgi:hypothetical protein